MDPVFINKGTIYKTESSVDDPNLFMQSVDTDGQITHYHRKPNADPVTKWIAFKKDKNGNRKTKRYMSTREGRELAGIKSNKTSASIKNDRFNHLFDTALAIGFYGSNDSFEEVYYRLDDYNKLNEISSEIGLQPPLNEHLLEKWSENKDEWKMAINQNTKVNVVSIVFEENIPVMFKLYSSKGMRRYGSI